MSKYLEIKDEKEKELYKKLILAEYEYLNYIKKSKIKQVEEKIRNKVPNPYHSYYNLFFCKDNNNKKDTNIKNKKNLSIQESKRIKREQRIYKRLLLITHPDKNIDNKEYIDEYYHYSKKLIEEEENEIIQEIVSDKNPINVIKYYYNNIKNNDKKNNLKDTEDNIIIMEEKIDIYKRSLWYIWSDFTENLYITREELRNIVEKEEKLL